MGVATPGLCGSGQQQQSRVDVDFEGINVEMTFQERIIDLKLLLFS